MTRPATIRSAPRSAPAQEANIPATAAPGPGGTAPARRERAWWRRLRALATPRPDDAQQVGLERLLALLEASRTELSAGWVQDGWWTSPADGGQQILVTGLAAGPSAPATVGAVCLAGALIRAGAGQGGDSEVGRAIDVVYDAPWESRRQQPRTRRPVWSLAAGQPAQTPVVLAGGRPGLLGSAARSAGWLPGPDELGGTA